MLLIFNIQFNFIATGHCVYKSYKLCETICHNVLQL